MTDAQHPAEQHSTEFGSNQSGIEAANAIALEQALAIVEQLKARLAEAEDKIKGLEKVQSVLPPDSFGLAMQTLKEQQNTLSADLLQAENVVVGVQINVNDTKKADRTTFQLRKEYLAVLANQLRDLSSLRALDTKAANPNAQTTELRLTHIYTTLNTTERVTRRVPKQSDTNDTHASESEQAIEFENQELALTALEAVRDRPKLVLLGEPGSGKSTFAQYIVLCLSHLLIQGATQEPWLQSFLGAWQAEDRNLLPVWITLREFAAWLKNRPGHASADDVHSFLEYRLKLDRIAESLPELIEPALRQGKALLLLDGLDEVIDPHKRKFICEAIVAYAKRYHADNRFLVTCRTRSYRAASDDDRAVYHRLPQKQFPEAQLADFNDEQIEHFIKAWHAELAQQEDETGSAELTRKCDRLVSEIPQRRHLRELAGNPLLLTLMAWIHTFTGELPQKRASFYERATQFLLWEWDQQKRDAHQLLQTLAQDVEDGVKGIERALWKAAFAAQEQLPGQSAPVGDADIVPDVSEQLLLDELKALKAGVLDLPDAGWADQVLYAIKHRSGLLKQRLGHTLTFPHRTFQE